MYLFSAADFALVSTPSTVIYHASYIKLIDDNPCAGIRYGSVSVDLIQDVEAGWTQGGCVGRHRLLGKDRTACRDWTLDR